MAIATKTLKLPFLRLNKAKADEFARLQGINTGVANALLALPKAERAGLTSKSFSHIEIGAGWICQTVRAANASTKVKRFEVAPLEVSNQGWRLCKVGDTYSVSFSLTRGVKKRVPLQVHCASHQSALDAILGGSAKQGSLKLWKSRKGIWYALISVSMDVPDTGDTGRWVGVDRGQNIPAAVATADGPVVFFKLKKIRHVRRVYAERRKKLQKAGKHRAVRKLDRKEARTVADANHKASKAIVGIAKAQGAGIRLEDLSGIRKNAKQRKATKTDAGKNRDYWPFFQLENFIGYKAAFAGVKVEKVPAAYTSKTCRHCGSINDRHRHAYRCSKCGRQAHADANAAMNIRDWEGLRCPLVLKAPEGGRYEYAPNGVRSRAA